LNGRKTRSGILLVILALVRVIDTCEIERKVVDGEVPAGVVKYI
jgi:hypothetical protein